MNKLTLGLTKTFATLFILVVAILGILRIFNVISTEDLTENSASVGGALLILVIASGLISFIHGSNKQ
jgi:hypothetical protein